MKYYVFGLPNRKNNMEVALKFKASNRLNFDENNYEAAVQKFYKADLTKYSHIFLVVDFEIVGDISLFGYRSNHYITRKSNFHTDDIIPFIILGERSNMTFMLNGDINKYNDNITVATKGFEQEFISNREAFEKFLYFKRIGAQTEMKSKVIENGKPKFYHIISTDDIILNYPKPIKRFKIYSRILMEFQNVLR